VSIEKKCLSMTDQREYKFLNINVNEMIFGRWHLKNNLFQNRSAAAIWKF